MATDETTAEAREALAQQAKVREALQVVIGSARRFGVELDEGAASEWVAALAVEEAGGDIVVDVDTGVFGHRASMLDFTPRDVARFRALGQVVGFEDRPPAVRTALALAGSAAQGQVQAFPGDCDFFERVHLLAPTRAEACALLADVIREKALATRVGRAYRLWEVKFGSYPWDGERAGRPVRRGGSISWTADEVAAGAVVVHREGVPVSVAWDEAAGEPGWCKLDWIVADPERGGLANASNMLDVTWEAPDGTIEPLDGFVDPYFQEVYLEPASLPLFRRLIGELSTDAVDVYVGQLQHEVVKYATVTPSWGKVARRLYNIFRLTGRYAEAAYIRELFDEPTTALYQLAALVRTLDEADRPGAAFDTELLVRQVDDLIMSAVAALEGASEERMVARLVALRQNLVEGAGAARRSEQVGGIVAEAIEAVNAYFEQRLAAVPSILAYVDELVEAERAKDEATGR